MTEERSAHLARIRENLDSGIGYLGWEGDGNHKGDAADCAFLLNEITQLEAIAEAAEVIEPALLDRIDELEKGVQEDSTWFSEIDHLLAPNELGVSTFDLHRNPKLVFEGVKKRLTQLEAIEKAATSISPQGQLVTDVAVFTMIRARDYNALLEALDAAKEGETGK